MLFEKKNMKEYQVLVTQKIRNFLLSQNSREFLIFLFFVLVSFSFWVLQMLDGVYQADITMQVRLKNQPKEVVMTSELPSEIQAQVQDRGTVLLNYLLGRSFYPLVFDFEDYQDMGNSVTLSRAEVSKKIATQLNTSTRLIGIRPDTLGYIYSRGDAKTVPVAISGQVTAGREFYVSDVKLEPDSVMVYAPQNVLNTIQTVYTVPVSFKGVTDTISREVHLQQVKGAKFIPSTNKVTVYVDMYSEKKVEVPIVGVNFPKGKFLRTFPSKAQVLFQIGLKNFSSVSADDFQLEVSYDDIMANQSDQIPLVLKKMPEHVGHVRIVPSSVDFLIEERYVPSADSKSGTKTKNETLEENK